jgi:hypothetical protein
MAVDKARDKGAIRRRNCPIIAVIGTGGAHKVNLSIPDPDIRNPGPCHPRAFK